MIGYYSYTVVLTYLSAVCAFIGMTQVTQGKIKIALYCLMACGTFDLFDGKVARTKKNRTDNEKTFGIQIDSLCDVLCFGMFPAMINYYICDGSCKILSYISSAMLVVCAVIRLGYFNVMEQERQKSTNENRKTYQGLPVTSDAVIIPFAYILKELANKQLNSPICDTVFSIVVLLIALFFVIDVSIKKPNNKEVVVLGIFGIALIFGVLMV